MIPALRARLFGERDAVAEQLRDIERQGSGIAAAAHGASFLLIVLFSLGSLVAFAGAPLRQLQGDWARGRVNLPATISMAVSLLVVVAMDTGLVYAALRLRLLATRRAGAVEIWLHVAVIVGVAATEAATYTYMSRLYDRPADPAAWAIIVMRGVAAPLLGVYLSLARPLPVGPGDVLYQVEFGAGAGFIRDATALASDPEAPLGRKALLYAAAAPMAAPEAERLRRVIEALATEGHAASARDAAVCETTTAASRPHRAGMSSGRHTLHPIARRAPATRGHLHREEQHVDIRAAAGGHANFNADDARSNVRTPADAGDFAEFSESAAGYAARRRSDTGMSQEIKTGLKALREEAARQIVELHPDIGARELTARLQAATGWHISPSTAQGILSRIRLELSRASEADGDSPVA